MIEIIKSLVAVWEQQSEKAFIPLSVYKNGDSPHKKSLQRVNMVLGKVAPKREVRLMLAQEVFGLEEFPKSTYDLTLAQVYAFNRVAYPDGSILPDSDFIQELEETLGRISEMY